MMIYVISMVVYNEFSGDLVISMVISQWSHGDFNGEFTGGFMVNWWFYDGLYFGGDEMVIK